METTTTIRFSERMSQLPPYLFGMINKIKMERRWNGEDVIDLGLGNPVDPAPNAVISKLCEVAPGPQNPPHPTAGGMLNLRREIALYYRRKYAVEMVDQANVAVTPGAGFGEEGDGYLRLALVENENRIRQGLKQMRRSLTKMEKELPTNNA